MPSLPPDKALQPIASPSLRYCETATLTRASATGNQAIAYSYDAFLTTRVAYSGIANGEYRYAFDNNFWVTGVALDKPLPDLIVVFRRLSPVEAYTPDLPPEF